MSKSKTTSADRPTPTPEQSKSPIDNGIAVPVFAGKSVLEENQTVGTKTIFKRSRTLDTSDIKRNVSNPYGNREYHIG